MGIDEQTFIEAFAKELNRSPRTPSPVGSWRFDRVRDRILEQFEATAHERGHLGVAVAPFNRGDEKQIKVRWSRRVRARLAGVSAAEGALTRCVSM